MLTSEELERLRWDTESDRTERKESASDGERIRQALCAFANDLPDHRTPGVLFVGLQDDGRCAKAKISDALLKTLAGMRDDGRITPFPTLTVRKHRFEDSCEVALVIVEPSERPPVRVDGRTWVRVGPRRATATADEERRLTEKRRAGDVPFDHTPVRGATLADLDRELFLSTYLPQAVAADVLAQNQRSPEWQLASLRLVTPTEFQPTVMGVLVLGLDPRRWIPGAYVQFVRFEGRELTDPIKSQKEIDGPLPTMLRILDEVLLANLSVAIDVTSGPTEVRRPDYPVVALRQLLWNAVMHRSYEATNAPIRLSWFSDRVEIQSPGGPFGQVRVDNFGQEGITDYRNPLLAEAMKHLGYVQRFGLGLPLARKELARNGSPALHLEADPGHILAVVRRPP